MHAQLWSAFVNAFRFWQPVASADQSTFDAIVTALQAIPAGNPAYEPHCPPVVATWLTNTPPSPAPPALLRLVQAVKSDGARLPWQTMPASYAGVELAGAYAFVELVGPRPAQGPAPIWLSETVLAGLTLQGPEISYASHWHPAIEFYGVLSGTGEWQVDDGEWVRQPAGSLIYHASNQPHAIRTLAEPILTFFAWYGDLKTFSVLTEKRATD